MLFPGGGGGGGGGGEGGRLVNVVYGLESSCNGLVSALADGMFEWSEVFICFRGNGKNQDVYKDAWLAV